jgi:hypothetical protein
MTYPLYASEWGLTHTATTAIFAVFKATSIWVAYFAPQALLDKLGIAHGLGRSTSPS